MTFREVYEEGKLSLLQSKVAEADLDAWYLLEYVTGISRAMYYVKQNEAVKAEYIDRYRALIAERSKGIPLQHLTGVQEFMGHTFHVNEHVLIPRQDTECLVEAVLDLLKPEMRILDMCTGSGCILLSILYEGIRKWKLNPKESLGVDISKEALCVAERNAKELAVEVRLKESDLFAQVEGQFDMIVSNPPYIRTDVIDKLQTEVKCHEPFIALDGKEDGLYFYRRMVEESPEYLKQNGWLCFEIGHDQGEAVSKLMQQKGFEMVTVKKDLSGLDRIVLGVYNKSEK